MRESLLDCLRDEIAFGLDRGERLAEVERSLIEGAAGLGEHERAAVWLFAWSCRPSPGSEADRSIGVR
jgi:hypothetical protein